MTWLAQRLLIALAEAQADQSVAQLAARVERDRHAVGEALRVLTRRGLIERIAYGVYRLAPAGQALLETGCTVRSGPDQGRAPRVLTQTLRHRVWTLLGSRRKVSLPELLRLAVTGQEKEAESNIRHYLRLLERTGYLLRLQSRKPGDALTSPGYLQWLVLRWTGPRPPVARRRFAIAWDPNLQREIKAEIVAEAAP